MRIYTDLPLIRLHGVCFSYPERLPVLKNIDFEFHKGDRIGLVGSNGSGKTTLLHIIMGLIIPQSGRIEIFGKLREEDRDFREVREKIGILFQDPDDQLFSPTVAEDVAFGPLNLGKTKEEALVIVHDTLKLLGLSGFEERITYQLSGGEKKLVSLATVLAMKPDILLLDEPVAGLDDNTKVRIMEFLKSPDLSFVIVSHDKEILHYTTKVLYQIDDGVIKRIESLSEYEYNSRKIKSKEIKRAVDLAAL
ncbi:ABC transporter ATP-binding protein [bacterium]|nr:ABC transporter ATP-binding protein [bacterium]